MRHPVLLAIVALLAAPAAGRADEATAFFEKQVRPVLVKHCYPCHSADAEKAKKLRGGLYLDTRDGVRAGGDSGPALVPGKPAESLLVKALKGDDASQMPPKGKLPAAVIADLEKWVALGAPDPRTTAAARRQVGMSVEDGRNFWAYKPTRTPTPPAVKGSPWPAGDIDRFILAALEAKGLKPAPDADRATLARRVYFDLTGLPPTPEEVEAFVRDRSVDAYEKLVDRLLASPAFGERWGRHWLDVARYAESVTLRGLVLKEAWRYRDYVIDSFNRDVPFDRFVREQIAGDLLPADDLVSRQRQLVATTFLALGNTNLEEQDKNQLRMDVVDEQLDVITKGFLAQTVTCARCHDHKFDPIPTRDYYALAGILRNVKAMEHANVSKWVEVPMPVGPAEEARLKAHEKQVAALQAQIKKLKGAKGAVAKGVLTLKDVPGVVVDDARAKKVGDWQDSTFSGTFIGDGYTHDRNADKGEKTLTFDPDLPATGRYEVRLAYSPGSGRADNAPVTVFSADGEKTVKVDMTQSPPIDGRFVSLGTYRFEKDGQSFVIVSNDGTKGHVTADTVTFVPADAAAKPGAKSSAADPARGLETKLKQLQDRGPKRPMVMTVVEEKVIEDARVHVRGTVHNLGETAPRGFLRVATRGKPPVIPPGQSGRKELADWIASVDNPLTARVYTNRAWHWLFGAGLVRTVDNFGTTGETPSHPELLDHLASQFVADGWSVKKLVRSIMLSRTYRQSSIQRSPLAPRADLQTARGASGLLSDPENRLFSRANRRRLEAECIRDAMLAVGGNLSAERGGPTFPANLTADYSYKHGGNRRSVYLPAFRNSLPEVFEAFDFADPSLVVGRRNISTVAPQALFLLNHPFVAGQADRATDRLLEEDLPDDETRLARAYRLTLGRAPTDGERRVAMKFLADQTGDPKAAWAAVFHALFASADFRYVD